MDPIVATAVAAISAGALASAKDVASAAVKDAYAGLKRLIAQQYTHAKSPVEALERNPSGQAEQQLVAATLAANGAGADAALRDAVQQVLRALEELRTRPEAAALFDFDSIVALQRFEVSDVETTPGMSVLRVRGPARFEGDMKLSGITQQQGDQPKKK